MEQVLQRGPHPIFLPCRHRPTTNKWQPLISLAANFLLLTFFMFFLLSKKLQTIGVNPYDFMHER